MATKKRASKKQPAKSKRVAKQTTSFVVPREVLELWRFADPEHDQLHLRCIHIEPDGEAHAIAVATDGHRMAVYRWAISGTIAKPIGIPVAVAKAAAKPGAVSLYGNGTLSTEYRAQTITTEIRETGDFPDWRKVLPAPRKRRVEFGINANYVGDIAIYLDRVRKLGRDRYGNGVRVIATGTTAPIMFKPITPLESGEFYCVIMPVRLD